MKRTILRAVWVLCDMCNGSGTVPVAGDRRKGERTCPNCGGSGQQQE